MTKTWIVNDCLGHAGIIAGSERIYTRSAGEWAIRTTNALVYSHGAAGGRGAERLLIVVVAVVRWLAGVKEQRARPSGTFEVAP